MVQFGLTMFATDYSVPVDILAGTAEKLGFESLFVPEHTHIPASRLSPWPGGADLPRDYWHTLDPFVSLALAASATKSLKIGTGISLITERDPILMAKQVATLDFVSGGRLILGVGAGWNREEMENHGVAFSTRWKILRERILAMREIWTQDEAEYHGEFVDFDKIWAFPKPIQAGGPKILIGASSEYVFQRIADYGDGWMPIFQDAKRRSASGGTDYSQGIENTRAAWRRAEREGEPDFSIFGVAHERKAVEELISIGFNRIIFGLPSANADIVLPMVEKLATIAHEF
mgnify:FL=1